MTKTMVGALLVTVAFLAGSAHAKAPTKAAADLQSKSGSSVTGTATFTKQGGKVSMTVKLKGLTPGTHAIHLHDKGDCSAPDAASAGGHWNPTSEDHGKWGHSPYHRGDIGNLVADAKGNATLTIASDVWTLGDGATTDVLGHAVVVHAKEDDFTTQPTGNAGGRVACGVIKAK